MIDWIYVFTIMVFALLVAVLWVVPGVVIRWLSRLKKKCLDKSDTLQ